jgi:hypothetical protein
VGALCLSCSLIVDSGVTPPKQCSRSSDCAGAINDFVVASNGLPPAPGQTNRRQLLYLGCSDQSNANKGV